MRDFAISLTIGLGVGLVYGLLRVRSPAPPIIALVGLLGMLLGEQAIALLRSRIAPPANIEAPKSGASEP
jgi:XapX domain-containing protein